MTLRRKPGPTARRRAAKRRRDLSRQEQVAAELQPRDGACRFFGSFIPNMPLCGGRSEPAHLGEKRRCHTRGMRPEDRHDRRWEANICTVHHRLYDAHKFDLDYVDPERGADGGLEVVLRPSGEVVGTI